jgi:hypothetical protein
MAKIILSSVDIQYLFFVKKQYKMIVVQITDYVGEKLTSRKTALFIK